MVRRLRGTSPSRRLEAGPALDVRRGREVLVERVAVRDRVDAVGELGLAVLEARDEGGGDDLADLDEVVGLQAAAREGRRADAQAGRDRRRARVERDGVAVDRDADLVQAVLGL